MSKALPPKPGDKKMLILAYALGVAHIIFGVTKLIALPSLLEEFTKVWQLPIWFMYFVGAAQLLGGILLFVRNLRLPASFSMALVMLGGCVTAAVAGQPINIFVTLVIMVLCLLVAKHRFFQLIEELSAEGKGQ